MGGTGRPETPPGTYGKIRVYRAGSSFRAMTLYREFDGSTSPVERYGPTMAAAERNLKKALADRVTAAGGGDEITPESRVKALAEHWWTEFHQLDRSPGTLQLYRDRLDNQIIPGLGQLRVRELTTGAVNRFIKTVGHNHGAAIAKVCRTVLSNMCGHACRLDAMKINPCREVAPVRPKVKNPPRALSTVELAQVRASFTYDDAAMRQELPDMIDGMLCTALRIAEVLAIQWPDLDLEAGTLLTGSVVVRVKGQGLLVKTTTTSKVHERLLVLPGWGVDLFRRRQENRRASKIAWDPVFMSSAGTLKDPDNAHTQLREAFDRMGYTWLVPHHFRKTAATALDKAGLTPREIADQLGHSRASMTLDTYMGRGIVNPRAGKALERLSPAELRVRT
ncbi:site-specific integrase [Pseudofrankia sp. BMG5.36]|uniref:site-specific integrase n=1 Tax=Pseudofrankia sp. BMG5.36 TaxID=1834512 RepID=UPI0008D93826|nr:site-specific integrase [Pseudofrankia sp. BMG5.36]OHV63677.1 hypothetical protein BCD48_37905 [Pseudofrankia sp. BMG5.36]